MPTDLSSLIDWGVVPVLGIFHGSHEVSMETVQACLATSEVSQRHGPICDLALAKHGNHLMNILHYLRFYVKAHLEEMTDHWCIALITWALAILGSRLRLTQPSTRVSRRLAPSVSFSRRRRRRPAAAAIHRRKCGGSSAGALYNQGRALLEMEDAQTRTHGGQDGRRARAVDGTVTALVAGWPQDRAQVSRSSESAVMPEKRSTCYSTASATAASFAPDSSIVRLSTLIPLAFPQNTCSPPGSLPFQSLSGFGAFGWFGWAARYGLEKSDCFRHPPYYWAHNERNASSQTLLGQPIPLPPS